MCEAALNSLHPIRLKKSASEGNLKAQYLQKFLENPNDILLTLMIGDWLADVTFIVLSSILFYHWIPGWQAIITLIFVLTPILIVFGELLPKTYAVKRPDTLASRMIPFIKGMRIVFFIPVKISSPLTQPWLGELSQRFLKHHHDYTEDELMTMVDISSRTGMLENEEQELVRSAFTFDEKTADAVLTPRVDMICVAHDTLLDDALETMIDAGYSRIPVYEEDLDHILGFIHIKDLLKAKQDNPSKAIKQVAKDFLRELHHVPENQHIHEILRLMQAKRLPICIVSDEYGGTAGLLTMEDLVEEIVGDFRDEFDDDEAPPFIQIDEFTVVADGKISVDELNQTLNIHLPNGQSIGGLVFNTLGEVPEVGQLLKINNVILTVEEIDGIRVQKVKVKKVGTNNLEAQSENSSLKTSEIKLNN